MKSAGRIRTQEVTLCLLCESPGILFYKKLTDKLFGLPGEWDWLRCPACGLVWVNPRPILEEMGKLYEQYHTHSSDERRHASSGGLAPLRRVGTQAILAVRYGYKPLRYSKKAIVLGRLLSMVPSLRDRAGRQVLWLENKPKGRLLEIGSGNGGFLAQMRARDWDVVGVEPDPVAIQLARRRLGLNVFQGSVEDAHFGEDSFEVIVMNNVIEHLGNPLKTLRECARLLRKGGKLVIVTPNINGLGHRVFRRAWRGLEPPRHHYLFSPKTLEMAVQSAGLKIETSRTTATGSLHIWLASLWLLNQRRPLEDFLESAPRKDRLESRLFSFIERVLTMVGPFGEELVIRASK